VNCVDVEFWRKKADRHPGRAHVSVEAMETGDFYDTAREDQMGWANSDFRRAHRTYTQSLDTGQSRLITRR
jgi:hypothetical protein